MTSKDYHKIIAEIYKEYNPDKVSEITTLLDKYKGQEEALLQSIIKKYKVSVNDMLRLSQQSKEKTINDVAYTPYSYTSSSYTDTEAPTSNRNLWIVVVIAIIVLIAGGFLYFQHEQSQPSELEKQVSFDSLEDTQAIVNSNSQNTSKQEVKSTDNNNKDTKLLTVEEYRYVIMEWSDSRVQYEYNNALVYVAKNGDNLTQYEVEMWKVLSEEAHRRHLVTF